MSIKTIEDCLETLVGLVDETTGQHVIDNNDYSILTSIGRQVFTGIALTDRQYEVVKSKIKNKYKHQFKSVENFDTVIMGAGVAGITLADKLSLLEKKS